MVQKGAPMVLVMAVSISPCSGVRWHIVGDRMDVSEYQLIRTRAESLTQSGW